MELLKSHRENDADVTIATHSVGWGQAPRRGLTRVDPDSGKPQTEASEHLGGAACAKMPCYFHKAATEIASGWGQEKEAKASLEH